MRVCVGPKIHCRLNKAKKKGSTARGRLLTPYTSSSFDRKKKSTLFFLVWALWRFYHLPRYFGASFAPALFPIPLLGLINKSRLRAWVCVDIVMRARGFEILYIYREDVLYVVNNHRSRYICSTHKLRRVIDLIFFLLTIISLLQFWQWRELFWVG